MSTKITQKQFNEFVEYFFIKKLTEGNVRFGKEFLTKYPAVNNSLLGNSDGIAIWMSTDDNRIKDYIEAKLVEG
jgi:hypothetical protein